jgi:hypothetical protein
MADAQRVVSLVHTIATDTALRERLTVAGEADRAVIMNELGYGDVSRDDVLNHSHLLFASEGVEEIDDDALSSVAGGAGEDYTFVTGVSAVCCAAVAT